MRGIIEQKKQGKGRKMTNQIFKIYKRVCSGIYCTSRMWKQPGVFGQLYNYAEYS